MLSLQCNAFVAPASTLLYTRPVYVRLLHGVAAMQLWQTEAAAKQRSMIALRVTGRVHYMLV
jgi:hypothetical protein